MGEYLVAVHDTRGGLIFDRAAEDGIDAVDIASDFEMWNLPVVGFVNIWRNADCIATYYSQQEALDALNLATGRC